MLYIEIMVSSLLVGYIPLLYTSGTVCSQRPADCYDKEITISDTSFTISKCGWGTFCLGLAAKGFWLDIFRQESDIPDTYKITHAFFHPLIQTFIACIYIYNRNPSLYKNIRLNTKDKSKLKSNRLQMSSLLRICNKNPSTIK